jgi:hypothetical protein
MPGHASRTWTARGIAIAVKIPLIEHSTRTQCELVRLNDEARRATFKEKDETATLEARNAAMEFMGARSLVRWRIYAGAPGLTSRQFHRLYLGNGSEFLTP